MNFTWLSLGWIFLAIFIMSSAVWFLHYYFRDRDKQKLMLAIAFLLACMAYVYLATGHHNIQNESILWSNIYHWSMFPVLITFLFALCASSFKIKDKNLNLMFRIFLVILAFSFISVFLPFSIAEISALGRRFVGIAVIIASGYLLIRSRDLSSLMFLMSIICFTAAGVLLVRDMEYFSILLYLMAHMFLTAIFVITHLSAENKKSGITSYFYLTDQLKTTERALHESEERYKRIVENTSDVIMLTQSNGVISYMSPACENILGYAPEELVGKVPNIFHPDDVKKVNETLSQAVNGNGGSDLEYRIKTKDGETKWVSHSWSPMLKDRKLQIIVSSVRDITDRKKMGEKIAEKVKVLEGSELATLNIMEDLQETITFLEKAEREIGNKNKELKTTHKELEILNEELENKVAERTDEVEKLLKQKDEFIGQLGHDLKNPLGPIINLVPLLEKKEKDPKSKEILEVIQRNASYMKNLVVKTIELARISSPNTTLSIENANLLDEINDVIEKNKLFLKENNIEIKSAVSEKIMVNVDKLRLTELFDNLISNAVKYSPDGGTITIDAKEGKDFVNISVKDTGMGMNEEQLSHIFDEFYKADSSRHDFDSSGLGLPICKRIIGRHGGKIWAESEGMGNGTTMFFTIPHHSKGQK